MFSHPHWQWLRDQCSHHASSSFYCSLVYCSLPAASFCQNPSAASFFTSCFSWFLMQPMILFSVWCWFPAVRVFSHCQIWAPQLISILPVPVLPWTSHCTAGKGVMFSSSPSTKGWISPEPRCCVLHTPYFSQNPVWHYLSAMKSNKQAFNQICHTQCSGKSSTSLLIIGLIKDGQCSSSINSLTVLPEHRLLTCTHWDRYIYR